MSQVPTVRGPVSTAELGPTYMHEHIFTLTPDGEIPARLQIAPPYDPQRLRILDR